MLLVRKKKKDISGNYVFLKASLQLNYSQPFQED